MLTAYRDALIAGLSHEAFAYFKVQTAAHNLFAAHNLAFSLSNSGASRYDYRRIPSAAAAQAPSRHRSSRPTGSAMFPPQKELSMRDPKPTSAISAADVPTRSKQSHYPEPYPGRMAKREKKPLGDFFRLKNFGVNLTRLAPGGESALMHAHSKQDEMIYVLEGEPTLVTEAGEFALAPGMCAGFPSQGGAHQLVNRTNRDVVILEIGDRTKGDGLSYPHDDLKAVMGDGGKWQFVHKNGTPF